MIDPPRLTSDQLFALTLEAAKREGVHVSDSTPPASRTCVVNDLALHFLDWHGTHQPPMLLLHGALLHAHVWDFVSLTMRQHFHIRALDLPGHGESAWVVDGDYSRARIATSLVGLIEQLDLRSLVLVGHSFGGAVAAIVAARVPERIHSLVMVDSTLLPSGRPGVRTRAAEGPHTFASYWEFVEHAATLGRRRDPADLAPRLRWNARQLEDGRWTWGYDPALRVAPLGPSDFEDVWSALRAIARPVLFVRASERSHLVEEAATRLQALPNVRIVVVPDAAHNVMTDNPVAFSSQLTDFLRSLDARMLRNGSPP